MKKVYPKPVTRVIDLELSGMLAGSGGVNSVKEGTHGMKWSDEITDDDR